MPVGPDTHLPRPRIGYLQILAGATLFGANASVSKVVLDSGIEPGRLTALRCTGVAIALLLWLGLTKPSRLRIPPRDLPVLALLGLTGAALIQWLYFVAIDRLPVGIALLLEFTAPLLIALYCRVVRHEAVHRHVWLALGLALAGLALVAQVWEDVGLDPIGVAAGLGAAVCLATFYLLGKHTLVGRDSMTVFFWMFLSATVFWAVAQPWSRFDVSSLTGSTSMLGNLSGIDVPVWVALVSVILLGTLTPYALEMAALRHLSATTTGIVGMIEPVVASVIAWIWLGQVLTWAQMLGGALVLTGVTIVQIVRADPAGPSTADPTRAQTRSTRMSSVRETAASR
jgi:drug/metabolite transporter (DMT)-like permease